MKNLRKVLALVLAVATLMSFAAMASAADFTDAAEIKNNEAVDLLVALGVVKGMGDDTFQPNGDVKRVEMAKMISVVMNGGKDINSLYASANTFEDMKTFGWGQGYVAYCATMGIINGRNEKTFDPAGKVTGTEAAKMLLCALGYSAENEGLTGTAWAANTLNKATALDFFKKVSTEPGSALTREGAAQMILNALGNETVSYVGGTNIDVNGVSIVIGGVLTPSGSTLLDTKFNATKADYADKFGRPGVVWTVNGKALEPTMDAPVYTKTGTINIKDVYKVVGKNGADIANMLYYSEGMSATTAAGREMGKKAAANFPQMTASKSLSWGGAGILHEVFYNADTDTLVYTTVQSRVGVISAVDEDNEIITVDGYDAATWSATGTEVGTFETDAFTEDNEGDIVIYQMCSDDNGATAGAINVVVPETQTVTSEGGVAASSGKFSTLYTNTGDISGNYHGNITKFAVGTEYVVYTDSYGYFVAAVPVEEAKPETKYLYVTQDSKVVTDNSDPFAATSTILAQVLTVDGVIEVVEVKAAAAKGLYSYTVDSKDVYTLTSVDATADADVTVTNSKAGIGTNYANTKTLFVVETGTTTKKYDVYTGIQNVPTLTAAEVFYKADGTKLEIVYCMGATVAAAATGSTELDISLVYTPNSLSTTTRVGADGEAYTYVSMKALINGSSTSLKVSTEAFASLKEIRGAGNVALITAYKLDDNGVVTEVTDGSATTGLQDATISAKYADGVITLNTGKTYVDESVVGYIYNSKSGVTAMQVVNVSKLPTNFAGKVLVKDGAIVAFYGTASI